MALPMFGSSISKSLAKSHSYCHLSIHFATLHSPYVPTSFPVTTAHPRYLSPPSLARPPPLPAILSRHRSLLPSGGGGPWQCGERAGARSNGAAQVGLRTGLLGASSCGKERPSMYGKLAILGRIGLLG